MARRQPESERPHLGRTFVGPLVVLLVLAAAYWPPQVVVVCLAGAVLIEFRNALHGDDRKANARARVEDWPGWLLVAAAVGALARLGTVEGADAWMWSLHATTSAADAFARPSERLLSMDVLFVALYVAAGLAVHVSTFDRAQLIEDLDPARFSPLANRLKRWSCAGVTYLLVAAAADLVENCLLVRLTVDNHAGSGLLVPLQVATWIKWFGLVGAVTVIALGSAASIVRKRDLNLGTPPSSDPPAEAQSTWNAGRAQSGDPAWSPLIPHTGVCLSGGGIRSASFSLGALQAISASKLYEIKYVASVSGGGYMAAAWAALTRPNPDVDRSGGPFVPRSPEERWVRHHTDYLVSSAGVVVASFLALLTGLLVNLLLVFLALVAVAHPLGWAVGSAHPEMGATVPIVSVRDQPRLQIVSIRPSEPAASIATDDPECDGCLPAREAGPAYVVELALVPEQETTDNVAVEDDEAAFDYAMSVDAPTATLALPLDVQPGLVAEGTDGLVVIRQPLVLFDTRELSEDAAAVATRVRVAEQPKLSVEALPELTIGAGTALDEYQLRQLVTIDRQAHLAQRSGTLGRAALSFPMWMVWVVAVIWAVAAVAFVLEPNPGQRRPAKHIYSQALLWLLAVAVGVLFVAAPIARGLPSWIAGLPGYNPSARGWNAIVVAAAAAIPLLWKLRGTLSNLGPLKRFRGRGLVLDAALGVVACVVVLAVFVSLVDLAAANGPGGRLPGVHEDWPWFSSLTDSGRWAFGVALLGFALVAPVSAHAWSLYTVYASGLASAYFLRAEPEGTRTPDDGPAKRYRIVRMRSEQRRDWSWDGKSRRRTRLGIPRATTKMAMPAPRLGGLSGSLEDSEKQPSVDRIDEWVVCTTANIRGAGEAAPGRSAGSFTFSKRWVGGPEVGWMETTRYLDRLSSGRVTDVSVPGSVTISGAAFSPAMGKDSKGWQGRLLALTNLRLGVWVANPMIVERKKSKRGHGYLRRPNAGWYFRELVGWFDRTAPYVYLTDGGHWENLGLVELLRRGCTDIWMISAAGDGSHSFETLAQAVALAREELGVEFHNLELEPLRAPVEPTSEGRRLLRKLESVPTAPEAFVAGEFRYPHPDGPAEDGTPRWVGGTIHVVEAALLGDLPWDVHAYAEANDDFPDIATGYQLMHHRDFEAYRMLGYTQTIRALQGVDLWHEPAVVPAPPEPPDSAGEQQA